MNNGDLYNIVLTVLKKESRGNIIKPDRFTHLLQQCHLEYFDMQYEKWAGSQRVQDSLAPFMVFDESVTFSGVTKALSGLTYTYKHAISARQSGTDGKVEIVTPNEWNEWLGDALMAGTNTDLLLMIDGQNLNIDPYSITSATIKFSYFVKLGGVKYDSGTADGDTTNKLVDSSQNFLTTVEVGMTAYNTTDGTSGAVTAVDSDTTLSFATDLFPDGNENYFIVQDDAATDYFLPFFDYYTDANYNVKYLTNGQTYTLGASEVYRDGTSSGKVVGVSHELKWPDTDKINIISLLLEKLGVSLQSPEISQYAMTKEQQQNIM
jgi:hypothetical protein